MIVNPEGEVVASSVFEGKDISVSVPSRWLVRGCEIYTRYLAERQQPVTCFVPGVYGSGQQPTLIAVPAVANAIQVGSGLPHKTEFTSTVIVVLLDRP